MKCDHDDFRVALEIGFNPTETHGGLIIMRKCWICDKGYSESIGFRHGLLPIIDERIYNPLREKSFRKKRQYNLWKWTK